MDLQPGAANISFTSYLWISVVFLRCFLLFLIVASNIKIQKTQSFGKSKLGNITSKHPSHFRIVSVRRSSLYSIRFNISGPYYMHIINYSWCGNVWCEVVEIFHSQLNLFHFLFHQLSAFTLKAARNCKEKSIFMKDEYSKGQRAKITCYLLSAESCIISPAAELWSCCWSAGHYSACLPSPDLPGATPPAATTACWY